MRTVFAVIIAAVCTIVAAGRADVSEFRMDRNRLWLTVQNEPLMQLLQQFSVAGVHVDADPSISTTVSGSWTNADVEDVLDSLLVPYDYLLSWQRETGPLGQYTRLSGIRVFREGYLGDTRPLQSGRRIITINGVRYIAREILVGFRAGTSRVDLEAFLARIGGTIIGINKELGVYRILLPEGTNIPELAEQLNNEQIVARAEPNYAWDVPPFETASNDSGSNVQNWTSPGEDNPVAVAVLDTGLALDENLSHAVLSSFDATRPGEPLTGDNVGHGTLMARLASGQLDPFGRSVGEGMSVVAVKAFADDGYADSFTMMNALNYAVENSSGPISLSWGTETPSAFIESAVGYAVNHGRPVVAAVGNKPTGKPMYPASCPGVIGVAASEKGKMADYSNYGDFVDVIVPGAAGGSHGTSVSTAHLGYVLGLYKRYHPKASAIQIEAALKEAVGPSKFLTLEAEQKLLAH